VFVSVSDCADSADKIGLVICISMCQHFGELNTGFTKLFGDLVTSTIWQEPHSARVLWITILAMKEADHVVRATVPGLAKLADITVEECAQWMQKFQEPDEWSRSQEFEGRRIERHPDGWMVLNGPKYQNKMRKEDRREQNREAQKKHRAKGKRKPLPNESQSAAGRRLVNDGKATQYSTNNHQEHEEPEI
jgi:hypothetical protein